MSRLLDTHGGVTYAEAGVSVDAGHKTVAAIEADASRTARAGVLGALGGFAGQFHLAAARVSDPVLVATTDGVGTKSEVARLCQRFDTIGIDLVAMLVDDLVCLGAEPLFVLDYVAVGRLDPAVVQAVVSGVAAGCVSAGAALLGGETAEHPGTLAEDQLDLAGFAVGVHEAGDELGPARVRTGDVLVGLHSPGLRSNGYALARRVLDVTDRRDEPAYPGAPRTVGEELLLPSVIYAPTVLAIRREFGSAVHAAAHVTGGGIVGNVPRALPVGCDAAIDLDSFPTPEIFFEIQRRGRVAPGEMVGVFNCGLGFVLAVDDSVASAAVTLARANGVGASVVGAVVAGSGRVQLQ